ncbi:hypothetical protein BJP24_21520 [Aeromonas allosaccharophila]|nr:hypothetical protein BJP24_21520 [Aeromonas allosaccharophila]
MQSVHVYILHIRLALLMVFCFLVHLLFIIIKSNLKAVFLLGRLILKSFLKKMLLFLMSPFLTIHFMIPLPLRC